MKTCVHIEFTHYCKEKTSSVSAGLRLRLLIEVVGITREDDLRHIQKVVYILAQLPSSHDLLLLER